MKHIKFKHIIYLLIITCLSFSCKKDWFDAKSNINQTVPSTLQDFEYLLDDFVTMNWGTPGLAEIGTNDHHMPEDVWTGNVQSSERNAYTWTNAFSYKEVPEWNLSYQRIFQCNLVLDGLKKIILNQDQERYNRIKGNALFQRAKNYYDLAQIYAEPYRESSAGSDIGIVLKEGIDVTEPAMRTSVKRTYEQILEDLKVAANLLPALPEVKSRGSKTGSYALLARTYLTIGDYINAGTYADLSLKEYSKLMDFNSIDPAATDMGRFNVETIFFAQMNTWRTLWLDGWVFIDPELYALYENNDLRKTRFFSLSGTNVVFKGNYNNLATVCFNGLAVDEQYLIRAECFARAGNKTAAMKDLNDLLKTRWDKSAVYPVRTAVDAEDALKQIVAERRKELLFRNLRWTDLRRLNSDPRFKVTLTRTIGGKTYTLEPESYKYTLPIPQDVLNLAPLMKQTPGWD